MLEKQRYIFKVTPDYTIATHGTQVMGEWAGKPLSLFCQAMGRNYDYVDTYKLGNREISEYYWE